MSVKLLTEHHLEFLCLTETCTGSSESTLVKMPQCWKSHVTAHLSIQVVALSICVLRHEAGQEGRGEILLENSFMR